MQEGGGGFGIQVNHSEYTLVPDTGDLWNVSCSMEPGVSQMQSPSSDSDFGCDTESSPQPEAKLVVWRKAFYRIPHKPLFHRVQGEPKTNVTCIQATYTSCTMFL